VSRRAPSRSPKVISTTVAFGSKSWSIMTIGVGTVSVSPWFPFCYPHKRNKNRLFYRPMSIVDKHCRNELWVLTVSFHTHITTITEVDHTEYLHISNRCCRSRDNCSSRR